MASIAQPAAPAEYSSPQSVFSATVSGLTVVVSSSDGTITERLNALFPARPPSQPPESRSRLPSARVRYDANVSYHRSRLRGVHWIARDGRVILRTDSRGEMLAYLERAITIDAASRLGSHCLIHAGAVARGQLGILMPAASGSGKSTLVAALTFSGFRYLSDEVAIVAQDGRLLPFQKSITLERGGWEAIADLFPGAASQTYNPTPNDVRHIMTADYPTEVLGSSSPAVEFVVIPQRSTGQAASLSPVRRSNALASIVSQSFNLASLGKQGLDLVHGVVKKAQCYMLTFDDLAEAVGLVDALVSEHPEN